MSSLGHVHERTFGSLDEFCEAARQPASQLWHAPLASQKTGRTQWAGSATLANAIDLAQRGWTEGREKVAAGIGEIFHSGAAITTSTAHADYEMAGMFPSVPLYCAGELECMHNGGQSRDAQKPVMRLWVCVESNCGVPAAAMVNRAAAVCSLVAELESQGQSLEVAAIFAVG